MGKNIKLSQWAKLNNYSYRGAFGIYQKGLIDGAFKTKSGSILVPIESHKTKNDHTIIYTRVSSTMNEKNLDTQAERISKFCNAKGWVINEIIKECASGLNDKRPKLQKILKENKATRIVVEHKDRLTRFGFEYIKTLFSGEIIIINETINDEDDLMQDFVSLVTSFCARLYGRRRSKRKIEKLIEELNNNE